MSGTDVKITWLIGPPYWKTQDRLVYEVRVKPINKHTTYHLLFYNVKDSMTLGVDGKFELTIRELTSREELWKGRFEVKYGEKEKLCGYKFGLFKVENAVLIHDEHIRS